MAKRWEQHLASLRVVELKNILENLTLSTVGKKSELQDRIKAYLGDRACANRSGVQPAQEQWKREYAEAVIKEVYNQFKNRNSNGTPTSSVGIASPSGSETTSPQVEFITPLGSSRSTPTRTKKNIVNGKLAVSSIKHPPVHTVGEIRCVCDQKCERGIMVQCEGEKCGVWQHSDCIGYTSKELPSNYFCEMCRAFWSNPFWEVRVPNVLPPTRFVPSGGPMLRGPGGVNEIQQVIDRSFTLGPPQVQLLRNEGEYQLQACCILLNDDVPFRYHWPRNCELHINGISYRVYTRSGAAKIGANYRDEVANISRTAFSGRNRVKCQINDNRSFVFMIMLVKRRTMDMVKELMAVPETLEATLDRVSLKSDDDLSMGNTITSLKDPISGARVSTPARFLGHKGLAPFDLDTFLMMVQRSRKWQCPHTMRNMRVQKMTDVTEIEVDTEGNWRPRGSKNPMKSITDESPLPVSEVKKEDADVETKGAMLSDSEDLSEGEELRRSAQAYARSTRIPSPEVIVLDDSSDDEPLSEVLKRPRVGNADSSQPSQSRQDQSSQTSIPMPNSGFHFPISPPISNVAPRLFTSGPGPSSGAGSGSNTNAVVGVNTSTPIQRMPSLNTHTSPSPRRVGITPLRPGTTNSSRIKINFGSSTPSYITNSTPVTTGNPHTTNSVHHRGIAPSDEFPMNAEATDIPPLMQIADFRRIRSDGPTTARMSIHGNNDMSCSPFLGRGSNGSGGGTSGWMRGDPSSVPISIDDSGSNRIVPLPTSTRSIDTFFPRLPSGGDGTVIRGDGNGNGNVTKAVGVSTPMKNFSKVVQMQRESGGGGSDYMTDNVMGGRTCNVTDRSEMQQYNTPTSTTSSYLTTPHLPISPQSLSERMLFTNPNPMENTPLLDANPHPASTPIFQDPSQSTAMNNFQWLDAPVSHTQQSLSQPNMMQQMSWNLSDLYQLPSNGQQTQEHAYTRSYSQPQPLTHAHSQNQHQNQTNEITEGFPDRHVPAPHPDFAADPTREELWGHNKTFASSMKGARMDTGENRSYNQNNMMPMNPVITPQEPLQNPENVGGGTDIPPHEDGQDKGTSDLDALATLAETAGMTWTN